ncbi:molecular chaperone [Pseudomonas sp. RP23018S]|uniref:fimbrial biogenesis chaperone n=1 Tax=Pseudomonas sp. RP23018S TaxID=3096037 RepID=UPI002ACAA173|nr:molecular chaperone [Pseudomonas sp. RP23018S]MDZ5604554.1 molecular chaperone [Pseudomonas sp. RP23018S]
MCSLVAPAWAGVTAERTRVIFHQGEREASLALVNQNSYPVIVQTWVDDGAPDSTPDTAQAPLMPLPPVLRLNAGQQRSLRLLYTGQTLPTDRESLYWLNIYEIPPQADTDLAEDQARLTVTLRTQMKVIYRPASLNNDAEQAPRRLRFARQTDGVQVVNPTPYFITLSGARLRDGNALSPLPGELLPPFSTRSLAPHPAQVPRGADVEFEWIDDGGNLQTASAPLN